MPVLEIGWSIGGRRYGGIPMPDRIVCGDPAMAKVLLVNLVRDNMVENIRGYDASKQRRIVRRMNADLEAVEKGGEAKVKVGLATYWVRPYRKYNVPLPETASVHDARIDHPFEQWNTPNTADTEGSAIVASEDQ